MNNILEELLGVPIADIHPALIDFVNQRANGIPFDVDSNLVKSWVVEWLLNNDGARATDWQAAEDELKRRNEEYARNSRAEARTKKREELRIKSEAIDSELADIAVARDQRIAAINAEFANTQSEYDRIKSEIASEFARMNAEEAEDQSHG